MAKTEFNPENHMPSNAPSLINGRKQTIVNLVIFREDHGRPIQQGCRFHVAPCEDGRWFAWAEAHQPPDDPEPCDALYDFFDGTGKAFTTHAGALAAIYVHVAQFCKEEAEEATAAIGRSPAAA